MMLSNKTLFPGIKYNPMKTADLKNFVYDAQRLGFTDFRKRRLLEAVAPFCAGVALDYCMKYSIENVAEFSAAAWVAIENAVNGFSQDFNNGFLIYLAYHLRAEFNKVIYTNFSNIRYYGDPYKLDLVSIDKKIEGIEGGATLLDVLPDETTRHDFEKMDARRSVEMMLNNSNLTQLQKNLIRERFGLENGVDFELDTIGEKYKRSKEWVRVKIKKALNKVRENNEAKTK